MEFGDTIVNSTLVTGSDDKTLRLWDSKTGKKKDLHEEQVKFVDIRESGSINLSGSRNGSTNEMLADMKA